MSKSAVRRNLDLTGGASSLDAHDDDLLPLRWSIPIWLGLAAASWAAVFYVVSLIV